MKKFILTLISFLLLGMHFFRAGNVVLAIISCAFPFILLFKNKISTVIVKVGLIFSLFVWSGTFLKIWSIYSEYNLPFSKAGIIIGLVIFYTFLNIILLEEKTVSKH